MQQRTEVTARPQGGLKPNKCMDDSIPFTERQCANDNSPTNRAMHRWLYKRQIMHWDKHKSDQTLAELTQTACDFLYPEDMNEYSLDDLRYGHPQTSVSKELSNFLAEYSEDPKQFISRKFSGRDPLEVAADTALATYLHSVMNGNSLINKIYNIDFYTNYCVNGCQEWIPNYLDPYEFTYHLILLRQAKKLTSKQLAFLQNTLIAMAHLDSEDLYDFMNMFRRNGLLVPRVLDLLRDMVLALELDPLLKKHLLLAFHYVHHMTEAWLLRKAYWARSSSFREEDKVFNAESLAREPLAVELDGKGLIESGHGLIDMEIDLIENVKDETEGAKDETESGKDVIASEKPRRRVYGKTGFDRSGFDRYGYDKQGFIRHNEQDNNVLRDVKAHVLQGYKKRVQLFLDRVRQAPPMSGVKKNGYYEPWDANLEWSAAQELVEKAQKWRSKRLDWSKFHYNRGIEHYIQDLEHTKEILNKMEADLVVAQESARRMARRSLGSLTTVESKVFKRNRSVDLTLGRRRSRTRVSRSLRSD